MIPDTPDYEEAASGQARRRRLLIVATLAGLFILWLVLAGGRLVQARSLALNGVDRLEGVRSQLDVDAVIDRTLIPTLEAAAADLGDANDRVRSPIVAPLRLVPWVGTQVRSADALSSAAMTAATALAEAADEVADLAEAGSSSDRVAVATDGLGIIRRARDTLDDLDLGPSSGLTRSLADARARFSTEVSEADVLLSDAEAAAAGLADFLEGPTTYLLLAANNSEMRAGSGSYLQIGTLAVTNGSLSIGPLRPAGDILLDRGTVAIADQDLDDRWGWLDVASDWRNLSLSPRFPASAELAASMWSELENEAVDGVMVIDPIALAAILDAAGPIEVDGRTIEASGVVRELLFDQYWEDDVAVRRDRLEEIARAAFGVVDDADIDLVTLARKLQDAAAGRHLLAWSNHPTQQTAWTAIGVEGGLTAESLAVSVLNQGANKLDPFLTVDASVSSEVSGAERLVTITLALDNAAQAAFPAYVLGPAAAYGYEPGTYAGFLAVNVPGSARRPAFVGEDSLVADGPDGATRVVALSVEVPPGERLVHELTFALPLDAPLIRIEPSARVPGISWNAVGAQWVDQAEAVVDLELGFADGAARLGPPATIVFERDPLNIPVAPIPFMRVDGDEETTVIVDWDVPRSNPPVDVWERRSDGDWELVGAAITEQPYWLPDRVREVEYCYRTALHSAPERFSAIECLTVPAALGYMRFPGNPADYFTTSDFVGAGDLDVRVLVAPDDWTPEFWQMFAGQYDSQPNDRAWRLGIDVFTAMVGNFSGDGVEDLGGNRQLPVGFGDGRRQWVRMTIEPERGVLRFWTSHGGTVWRQLGDDRRFDPIAGLHDSTGPVYVGTDRPGSDNPFSGKLYYVEVREGIDGPTIANLDFRTTDQMDSTPAGWIDDYGNVFQSHGSGWEYVLSDD